MNDASLEQVHRYLFERIADGVLIIDAEGMIEAINPAAVAMLGITGEQARGKRSSMLFRNNASLLNLLNRPGEQVLDVRLPRRRLALGMASQLENNGKLIILQDVTEQRKLDFHRQE
ncbi:MAG: PAS domain S-box protein, partial [Anaerolineae bacterium]|nr:PAS domain S-box protein [Anaerolineae bacterium]